MITRFIAIFALLLLPFAGSAQCQASFTYTTNGSTVTFDGSVTPGPAPGAQYLWWFSDNNTSSTQQDPVHTFSAPGSYMVCFTVYDSLAMCMDSVCQTIVIAGGCNADFMTVDSVPYVFFFGSSTLGPNGYYVWDFGDGNYSTQMNPSHIYTNPGLYVACLTVYDSLQNFCDSTCHVIQVAAVGMAESDFLQSLNASPNPADDNLTVSFATAAPGTATITLFDAAGRVASLQSVNVTSAGSNRTDINTSNLSQGIYLVKIAVNGNAAWTRVAITHQSQR